MHERHSNLNLRKAKGVSWQIGGGGAWNSEDIATLKRLYTAGRDNLSIARAFGRTEISVVNKIRTLRRRRVLGDPPGKKVIKGRSYGA